MKVAHDVVLGGQKWPRGQGAHDGGAPKAPAAQTHAANELEPAASVVEEGPGHGAHVAFDGAPVAEEKVPAGQRVALTEESGQKEPGGQRTGAPEEQK